MNYSESFTAAVKMIQDIQYQRQGIAFLSYSLFPHPFII
jgi:hypothetical protein